MASSHPFTCNTCQVAFRGSDLQRTHMQSDWHRYNLKRRVASLPPLTSEVFAEKVLANKASAAATAARASFQKHCDACDKTYFSNGAFSNHLGSQKHKILQARLESRKDNTTDEASLAGSTLSLGEPVDNASTQDLESHDSDDEIDAMTTNLASSSIVGESRQSDPKHREDGEESETEDEEYTADPAQCLFCNQISKSMDLNTQHMSQSHGFFVPEREYLTDMPGLITHLSETIHVLNQCLYCHKMVHTPVGAQTHMRDRGHCMMAYSTEDDQLDVGDFYDFRATYSDEETDSEEEYGHERQGTVMLGAKRKVKTVVENEDGDEVISDEDDQDWESGSEASSVPTDEITSVPVESHNKTKSSGQQRSLHKTHKNVDGYHSRAHHQSNAVFHSDYELYLPSGRMAGHRSLRQYFRQNLPNYYEESRGRQPALIEDGTRHNDANRGTDTRGRQLVSRANGGTGLVGVSEAKKREIRAVEKRQEKRAQRAEARQQWGNNKRSNHQKHYRDPLLQ